MSPSTHRRTTIQQPTVDDSCRASAVYGQSGRLSDFLGRLVFPTGHGPRSVIAECHRTGDGFVIRLPEFNDAGHYLADAPVALSAVLSAGPAQAIACYSRVMADYDVDADARTALEHWPAGVHAHYFHISATQPGVIDPEAHPDPIAPPHSQGLRSEPNVHAGASQHSWTQDGPPDQVRVGPEQNGRKTR